MTQLSTTPPLQLAPERPSIQRLPDSVLAISTGAVAALLRQLVSDSLVADPALPLDQLPVLAITRSSRVALAVLPGPSQFGALEPPISIALRALTKSGVVPDLVGINEIELFVPSGSSGSFAGMGDTYLAAPGKVVLVPVTGLPIGDSTQLRWSAASGNYQMEATSSRRMTFPEIAASEIPARCSCGGCATTLELSMPARDNRAVYSEFEGKWRGKQIDLQDQSQAEDLMRDLHQLALTNVSSDGGPFAAVVVSKSGQIIGIGANQVFPCSDATAHGERVALWDALANPDNESSPSSSALIGSKVVTSSYTCVGCAEACARAGVSEIIYGNSRQAVHDNTRFTEGPLDPGAFAKHGITLRQLRVDPDLELAAFRAFAASQAQYLVDQKT